MAFGATGSGVQTSCLPTLLSTAQQPGMVRRLVLATSLHTSTGHAVRCMNDAKPTCTRCYNKTALLRNRASFDPSRRNRKGVGAGLIIGIRVVGLSSNTPSCSTSKRLTAFDLRSGIGMGAHSTTSCCWPAFQSHSILTSAFDG